MPRYYHSDSIDIESLANAQGVDDEDKARIRKELTKHHPLTQPSRDHLVAKDGQVWLRKPGMYCQKDEKGNPIPELVPFERGSIAFGIPGYQFFVVPPGGYVDIDYSIPEKVVKDAAPHLMNEAEHMLRSGVKTAKEKPSPKSQQS